MKFKKTENNAKSIVFYIANMSKYINVFLKQQQKQKDNNHENQIYLMTLWNLKTWNILRSSSGFNFR